MSPGRIQGKVAAAKAGWVRAMLEGVRALPLRERESFAADARNLAAAESYLRRALEALLDLGRHVLAKGFGKAPSEYRQIAEELVLAGVLDARLGETLARMAGYRNRMVHLYNEVGGEELRLICLERLDEVEEVLAALLDWIGANRDRVDEGL